MGAHFIIYPVLRCFLYFWADEGHLEIFALIFETTGAFIDVLVALWIFKTLGIWIFKSDTPVEGDEEKKKEDTREKLEATFGILTAILLFVAVACGWRIIVLHGKSEAEADRHFNSVSNRLAIAETNLHQVEVRYDEATNDLVLASNAATDATEKLKKFSSLSPDRTISPEQKAIIVNRLRPISASVTNKYIVLNAPQGDFEAIEYAKQIGEALTESGFNPELLMSFRWADPAPTGIDFCLGSRGSDVLPTNIPTPSINIIMAFKTAGIKWQNLFDDTNSPEGKMVIFVNHNAPSK